METAELQEVQTGVFIDAEFAPRNPTWIEDAIAQNPNQILELDPANPEELIVNPARNSRPTPPIGDKSLRAFAAELAKVQLMPGLATINEAGAADLYAGFRRVRALQTWNQSKGLSFGQPGYKLYRVLITVNEIDETDILVRSLAENVFRQDMMPLEKTDALKRLMSAPHNLTLKQSAEKLNMSAGGASTYLRFDLFPLNAKRAMSTGKLGYGSAEKLIKFLPDRVKLAADEDGTVLAKAQERIDKMVAKELAAGGSVSTRAVDQATRSMQVEGEASEDGEEGTTPARSMNKTQRKTKVVIAEIDEYIASLPEDRTEMEWPEYYLAAFKKFVNGGALKSLVKTLSNTAATPHD